MLCDQKLLDTQMRKRFLLQKKKARFSFRNQLDVTQVNHPGAHKYARRIGKLETRTLHDEEALTSFRRTHQRDNIPMSKLHFLAVSLKLIEINVGSIGTVTSTRIFILQEVPEGPI